MRKLSRQTTCSLLGGLLVFLASFLPKANARRVWIDTDLTLGSPLREVDDGYALLLAFRSPELQIAGISTTYGNAPLRGTTSRTREALRRFGLTMTVNPGAASPNELGRATPASDALAAALHTHKRVTYIALGPLTNLASFVSLHPEQARRIDEVIMVAGKTPEATLGFGPEEKFRIHDANFVKDPAAMRAIFASPIPISLAPIETSARLLLDAQDLRTLEASDPAGRFLSRKSGLWLRFWTHFVKAGGGPVFDALAVVAAARPNLVMTDLRTASIEADGSLIVRRKAEGTGRKVRFCSGFVPATKAVILDRLTGRREKSSSAQRDR